MAAVRSGSRPLVLLAATTIACASGCQELIGIDPWSDAKGGAASTSGISAGSESSSGTDASASSSTSHASSSTGMACAGCFGASCTNGVCDAVEVDLEQPLVSSAKIEVLATDVIVATTAGGTTADTWTLSTIAKDAQHTVQPLTSAQKLTAMAVAEPDTIFWATGDSTLHQRPFTGADTLISSTARPTDALRFLQFANGAQLCFTFNDISPAVGGIFCQVPAAAAAPTQIAAFSFGAGLTGDGIRAYAIQNAGIQGSEVVGADPVQGQAVAGPAPFAKDVAYQDGRIYWLAPDAGELGYFAIGSPMLTKTVPTDLTMKKILAHGQWIYVLTQLGILRFTLDLEVDAGFAVGSSGLMLDFAVDEAGIYWVTGGPQASVGFRGWPSP